MRPKGLLLTSLAVLLMFPAAAMAASPPSITSSFYPTSIGIEGTSTLSFTISNPAGNGTLTGIGFTDTLPVNVVVDAPNGAGGKCGSASLNPTSGTATISLSGGTLAAGTSCTVSVNVTSNTAGVYENTTGEVTSNEGGTGNSDSETLTVLNPPSATITSPASHATYAYGQKVLADYSCQDDPNGPGIQQPGGCQGDVPNGSPIDTKQSGRRSFTVTAISNDGQVTFTTVNYTVLPPKRYRVWNVISRPNGRVGFDIEVPDRGKLAVVEHAAVAGRGTQRSIQFGQLDGTVTGAEGFVVYPTAAGSQMVQQVRSANRSGGHETIAVTLALTFTPAGGGGQAQTYQVTISP